MTMKPITSFCTLNMGQSPDSKTYNTDGIGIPFYQGNADFGETHPITRIWCSSPIKKAKKGDILISVRAPIGAMNIADEACCIGRGLAALTPHNDTSTQYLYYAVQSRVDFLISKGTGSTFKAISKKVLEETLLPAYSSKEQKEIVFKLDTIDTLIAQRQQQLKSLEQLVKSRFIEMFDGKGYPQVTIGELVTSKVPSVKKAFTPTDVIKYIDISSIDNIRNVMTGYTEYVLQEAPSRAQQHIKKGDIVISTVRPNLKNVAITTYEGDNLVASSGFCVLRANKCLSSYLMAIVCSEKFTEAMIKLVTGANYPAIKDSDVLNYVVALPPIKIQEQFATFVEQVDKSKYYGELSKNILAKKENFYGKFQSNIKYRAY